MRPVVGVLAEPSAPCSPLAPPAAGVAQDGAAQAAHSRFVQRVRRRYAAELPLLPAGVPSVETITALVLRLQSGGTGDGTGGGRNLPCALRVARQLVLERLAVLDIEEAAPLEVVTGCMTHLAEATKAKYSWKLTARTPPALPAVWPSSS